ncbi:TetR/AcrR family transcriptional regulator [Streptosporangium sp. G11]|uniref:TetR/AcrR family transcriptional regulator n=1 Tax=Streptosporangium sp. G11 TaxID=3436926 RepID=UPI003EB960A7
MDGIDLTPAVAGTRKVPARERILITASELFYAEGLRAVSADKIIARASITKVTFYRHFPTKDDLIVAYLERRAAWEREAVRGAWEASNGDVSGTLKLIADGIGTESCSAGFRGCPFINAAAEYADGENAVRKVVGAHRAWFHAKLAELVANAGIPDAETTADELVMLRDGAMVCGYLGDPAVVSRALYRAGMAIVGLPVAL